MMYKKNLPGWERAVRIGSTGLLFLCAYHYGMNAVGIAFGVAGGIALLTALVGFCPACYVAGRRGSA